MRRRSLAQRHPVIVFVSVFVVVACPWLFLLFATSLPAVSGSGPRLVPWGFPGAYASYSDSTMLLGELRYTMNYAIKVLAVDGTMAKVLCYMRKKIDSDPPIIQ